MSWAKLRMVRGMAERRALRRVARAQARAEINEVKAQDIPTADDASGCEGRAAEVLSGPAPVEVAASPHETVKARQSRVEYEPRAAPPVGVGEALFALDDAKAGFDAARGGKIDLSRAPSGMEAAAARWKSAGPVPMEAAPIPVLCAGEVLCRCGARASGKGRGPVPAWFGDKCIEAKCELRA